jgi:hypothetical protein
MTEKLPKITALNPVAFADNHRVMMELIIEDLPTTSSNVAFMMPDISGTAPPRPPKLDPDAPSPYPNVELSILNSQRQQLATLFIVEHSEPYTSLTLHLHAPNVSEQYTARAEMTHQDKTLDVVEVPFTLHQTEP